MMSIQGNRIHSGFTLIELMVVIVVMAILMAIAAPAFQQLVVSTRLTSQANDLVADILLARGEAANRGLRTIVCPSTDGISCSSSATDWPVGRIVFVDAGSGTVANDNNGRRDSGEPLLKYSSALAGTPTLAAANFSYLNASANSIGFNPYGGLVPLGTRGTFKLCFSTSTGGKQIAVDVSGRPSVTNVTCP